MIAQANDRVMNKAVFILKTMSADEKVKEIARMREEALHEEASYLETARLEGRAEGMDALLEKLRALGADEKMLSQAVSDLSK